MNLTTVAQIVSVAILGILVVVSTLILLISILGGYTKITLRVEGRAGITLTLVATVTAVITLVNDLGWVG